MRGPMPFPPEKNPVVPVLESRQWVLPLRGLPFASPSVRILSKTPDQPAPAGDASVNIHSSRNYIVVTPTEVVVPIQGAPRYVFGLVRPREPRKFTSVACWCAVTLIHGPNQVKNR